MKFWEIFTARFFCWVTFIMAVLLGSGGVIWLAVINGFTGHENRKNVTGCASVGQCEIDNTTELFPSTTIGPGITGKSIIPHTLVSSLSPHITSSQPSGLPSLQTEGQMTTTTTTQRPAVNPDPSTSTRPGYDYDDDDDDNVPRRPRFRPIDTLTDDNAVETPEMKKAKELARSRWIDEHSLKDPNRVDD